MPKFKINKKLQKLFTAKQQIIVLIGGRGSGKSIAVGDFLTFKMDTEDADIYCLREFQDSVSDSVHRVLTDSIQKRLCLNDWSIQENKITSPQGAKSVYKGANRNPDSMQSAQGYKYSWFEEAHRASQNSLDKLLPTILRNPGAKCIFTANPQSSADPFSQRFITPYKHELDKNGIYEDNLHLIIKVNWRDNPWWNEEQEQLRTWDEKNLSRAKYRWIWEGDFYDEVEDSIIKVEWFDACIDAHKSKRLENVFKTQGAVIAAHDPSDGGDNKGYACRHASIFTRITEQTEGEIDEGVDWATNLARKDKADWFLWDGDGMGAGCKRQIDINLDSTRIKAHMFRGSLSGVGMDDAESVYMPSEMDRNTNPKTYCETFKNNRSRYAIGELSRRMYNTYRCVVKGEYVDPDDMISIDSDGVDNINGLRSEVCRVPRKMNSNGLEQVMSKQDMAKLGIKSPGMFDSMMMTMFTPKSKTKRKRINYQKVSVA